MQDIISANRNKVIVSRVGVALFNAQWPCSTLRTTRAYWFEFDDSGDLVDTDCPEHDDGPAASALADDCKAWLEDGTLPDWIPARYRADGVLTFMRGHCHD